MNEPTQPITPPVEPKPDDTYILIQPIIKTVWIAQLATIAGPDPDPDQAKPEETFSTLEEAIQVNSERAESTVHGFQVFTSPFTAVEATSHSEQTLIKVYSAMQRLKIPRKQAFEIVNAILNEGILFRERA